MPYIIDRIMVRGLWARPGIRRPAKAAIGVGAAHDAAHANTVENLVVFGLLVLVTDVLNIHTALTAFACAFFFWCRLVYVAVYTAGIPVLRTLAFAGGWIAQMMLVLAIFGMM